MEAWKDKIIRADEVADLYNDTLGEWLLLEVLKFGPNGKAELFKLLMHAAEKEQLHDYMMDDEDWSWDKKYILVFADPEKTCDI